MDYVSPAMHGEAPICEIELDDISSELAYWRNGIVCYVLGAYPPFSVRNGYIQRQWGKLGINKVSMLKNGVVLVRFDSEVGKNDVLQGGIYHFDNKPFIVKAWNLYMEFSRDELYTVPIWVKLPGLEFKYWSQKGLSKIGSLIGKPLMVDNHTEKKIGLTIARLLIEVDMNAKLPDKVYFRNEKGNLVEQKLQYDWKPTLCEHCQKYGHSEEECRKKKAPVQVQHPKGKEIQVDKGMKMKQVEQEEEVGRSNCQMGKDLNHKSSTNSSEWVTPRARSPGEGPKANQKQGQSSSTVKIGGSTQNAFQVLTNDVPEQPNTSDVVKGGGTLPLTNRG